MQGILEDLWENQEVVTRQNRYHGHQFRVTRGTTQGGIVSPTLFTVAVNSVVRNWILLTVEYGAVIQEGLVHAVVWSLGVLYMDHGLLGLRYPEWLQGALNVLIGLFLWIGLAANVAKSKTMTC